jgi:pyruvate dehydrogenase E2 component (dihydrolipoamide acetyltransferase)
VRRLAREIGVDLVDVLGSGPGGRISEDDVKHAAREVRPGEAPAAPGPAPVPTGGIEVPPLPDFAHFGPVEHEPLTRFRRTVARNMATSWAYPARHLHWWGVTSSTRCASLQREPPGGNLTVTVILLEDRRGGVKAHLRMNASST